MYKEIREQINKVINWNKSLNSDKIISEQINNFIKENGFVVQDIYDVENVSGIVSALKLSEVFPIYLYEGIDFELDNRPYNLIDMETGESLKLQPNEIKTHYKKAIHSYFEEIKLRCANHRIDFMPADIQMGYNDVLLKYLIKRQKLH